MGLGGIQARVSRNTLSVDFDDPGLRLGMSACDLQLGTACSAAGSRGRRDRYRRGTSNSFPKLMKRKKLVPSAFTRTGRGSRTHQQQSRSCAQDRTQVGERRRSRQVFCLSPVASECSNSQNMPTTGQGANAAEAPAARREQRGG